MFPSTPTCLAGIARQRERSGHFASSRARDSGFPLDRDGRGSEPPSASNGVFARLHAGAPTLAWRVRGAHHGTKRHKPRTTVPKLQVAELLVEPCKAQSSASGAVDVAEQTCCYWRNAPGAIGHEPPAP